MFLAEDGEQYPDEYFYEFQDMKWKGDSCLTCGMWVEDCACLKGLSLAEHFRKRYPQIYRDILGVTPPEPGQELDGPLLGHEDSRELLAKIYGCPVDLVEDVLKVKGL